MPNYANITIVGHLGRDPEMRYTDRGDAVCSFSVAVSDPFKKDDPPTWYNCSVWGKSGERAGEMLSKGTAVLVNGRPKLRKYQARDGSEGHSLDVRVSEWTFASSKGDKPQPSPDESSSGRQTGQHSFDDDDVPF